MEQEPRGALGVSEALCTCPLHPVVAELCTLTGGPARTLIRPPQTVVAATLDRVVLVDEAGAPVDTLNTDGSGEQRAVLAHTSASCSIATRANRRSPLPHNLSLATAAWPAAAAVAVEVRRGMEVQQRIKRNQWGSFFQVRGGMWWQ